MVRGSVESLELAGIFSTYPNPHINFVQAFAVEMVITAILMGVILALTDDGNGVPRGPLAPLLIGLLRSIALESGNQKGERTKRERPNGKPGNRETDRKNHRTLPSYS